ncbi:MAG: hypothetical protein M3P84_08790, partial [Chloroflexota bacterium]|nr:hypothetical protein [Chloroflexota bacterium]
MRLRGLVAGIQRLPAYPALVVAAFVLTVFTASSSPVESLSRPLVVAVATTLLAQGLLTLVFRSGD